MEPTTETADGVPAGARAVDAAGALRPRNDSLNRNPLDAAPGAGVAAGEPPAALDRFLAAAERRAFLTARLATGSREDALDIVQEAMVQLVRYYSGRDEAEWGPLFQRILQSRIRDWYRRTRVRQRLRVWLGAADDEGGDPIATRVAAPTPGPGEQLARARAVGALERALTALPLRQRQAFLLRAWQGLDVDATARAMGCSQGSVKTHYSRALAALRAALGDHWP